MAAVRELAFNFTAANQFSPWLMHNVWENPFNVTLAVYFGFGLAATLQVQYIADDASRAAERQVWLSQTTNTITVTDPGPIIQGQQVAGHGLAVGDYVNLHGTPGGTVDGDYNVATVVSAQVYTLTSTVSQTLALTQSFSLSGRLFTHATLIGLTARASGNYNFPTFASRLLCTAFTTGGYGFLVALQGGGAS
jgi:hypothetical protein